MDRRRWNVFFFNFLLLILFFLHIILIYLSTYLLVMLHGMAYGILVPQTRDQTHTPCIGNSVLTTGPPGKSQKKMDSWNIHMVKLKKKKQNTSCLYLCLFKYSEKERNHGWKERLWLKQDLGYSFQDAIYIFNALVWVFHGYLVLSLNANPFFFSKFLQMTSWHHEGNSKQVQQKRLFLRQMANNTIASKLSRKI